MSLTIGELAQRLRVTPRALRHYDQLGLLVPEHVDPRTGYRTYGGNQLVRGMQIEQLKATGLSLESIKNILDDHGTPVAALRQRREQIEALVAEQVAQIAAIDALLVSRAELAAPVLVQVPELHAVVDADDQHLGELARTIRREMQQLGRSVRRCDGMRCRSFSARFPLRVDDRVFPVEVAGHLDEPSDHSTVQPAETRLSVVFAGHVDLLPLAYDAVLTTARDRGLEPCGTVVEHYLDLATVGRTEVSIPLLA